MVFSLGKMGTHMKDSGWQTRKPAKESLPGIMAIGMKAVGKPTKSMGKEFILGSMEIDSKESG